MKNYQFEEITFWLSLIACLWLMMQKYCGLQKYWQE